MGARPHNSREEREQSPHLHLGCGRRAFHRAQDSLTLPPARCWGTWLRGRAPPRPAAAGGRSGGCCRAAWGCGRRAGRRRRCGAPATGRKGCGAHTCDDGCASLPPACSTLSRSQEEQPRLGRYRRRPTRGGGRGGGRRQGPMPHSRPQQRSHVGERSRNAEQRFGSGGRRGARCNSGSVAAEEGGPCCARSRTREAQRSGCCAQNTPAWLLCGAKSAA